MVLDVFLTPCDVPSQALYDLDERAKGVLLRTRRRYVAVYVPKSTAASSITLSRRSGIFSGRRYVSKSLCSNLDINRRLSSSGKTDPCTYNRLSKGSSPSSRAPTPSTNSVHQAARCHTLFGSPVSSSTPSLVRNECIFLGSVRNFFFLVSFYARVDGVSFKGREVLREVKKKYNS